MKRLLPLLALGFLSWSCAEPNRSAEFEAFGTFIDSLMAEHAVPGVGFALFDDSGLIFEHVIGLKSQEGTEEIHQNTAFEGASISKPVFAYLVLSLVHDGVLELDSPLRTLVPEIPAISYDPRSEALTPRLLLSHRGGLPNWRSRIRFEAESYSDLFESGDTLRFVMDPDTEYFYSGEGYVLLQQIIEEMTGKRLTDLAKERVFLPLGMTRTSFLFDAETKLDFALGHDRAGSPDKWEIRQPLASSTLHTTASDFSKFGARLASEIRTSGPYSELATPSVLVTEDGEAELSWGLGLGIVTDGYSTYIYHGGNNVIFIADFMYGIEENLGYVLLTNSANGQRMVEAVENRVFGHLVRR